MPILAFRLPGNEEGRSSFVAIDDAGEWHAHEDAPSDSGAAVLARFAALAPPDVKRRCDPDLAEEGRGSGWFPTARGLQRWKRLAAFALDIDPHCTNRVPLDILGALLERGVLWQKLDPSRYPMGSRVDLISGVSEGESDDAYAEGDAYFHFWGRRGAAEMNGLHLHYTQRGEKERSISMSFTPEEPGDPVVCAGFRPMIYASSRGTAGFPPTAKEILVFLAHLDVLLNAKTRSNWNVGSTIGYGHTVVTAQTWESLPW